MHIIEAALQDYTLSIRGRPEKKGLILSLITEDGRRGLGDISPLPGFSVESLEDAKRFAELLIQALLQNEDISTYLPPSVSFAYQSALTQIQSPLEKPLFFTATHLIYGDETDLTEVLPKTRVKLKLGTTPIERAIDLAKELIRRECALSIDLNRKWPWQQTVTFCKALPRDCLLYIEEPSHTFTDLSTFYEETGIAYALDESISLQPIEVTQSLKGLKHLIIKPTILGGAKECRTLLKHFPDVTPIFSSSFESTLGLMHIALLSDILAPGEPVGIGTFRYTNIEQDPFPIDLAKGFITPKDFNMEVSV